jgi:hypothetical protein
LRMMSSKRRCARSSPRSSWSRTCKLESVLVVGRIFSCCFYGS